MRYLAELVTNPGQAITALALAGEGPAHLELTRQELLDPTARRAYRARVGELRADLAEAEAMNDLGRVEQAQTEFHRLVDHLEASSAIGGRTRGFVDSGERARTAVQKALKRALDAIEEADPFIAGVLRRTITTGVTCVYTPESGTPVVWTGVSVPAGAEEDPIASMDPVEVEGEGEGEGEGEAGPEPTIGDRLVEEGHRHFVGRAAELELARVALEAPRPHFSVLFIHGPGGVGKTTLLDRLASSAFSTPRAVIRIDLHTIEPTPAGFLAAFAGSVGRSDRELSPEVLAECTHRMVLIDTFERGESLKGWLRRELIAHLPSSTLVAIAGRNPPPPEWLADPGWRAISRVVALDNLSEDEARRYLELHGVEQRFHARLWALTRGHPLALSLVVDLLVQRTRREHDIADLMDTPDIVRTLMQRFVGEIPDRRHREALAVCAHTRYTTEDLLRSAVDGDEAGDGDGDEAGHLFEWLRSRPFIEKGRFGLFPHDLAREVLDTDLRWRDRIRYDDLHHRIRRHLVGRLRASTGHQQQEAAADMIYLHRLNPIMRPLFDWTRFCSVRIEPLAPGDRALVLGMTEHHQGAAQAELARHWLDRQPEAFRLFRGADELVGYTAVLQLQEAAPADVARDPGTRAVWEWAMAHDPPRRGEKITVARFAVDRATNQARPSASHDGFSIAHFMHTQIARGLTWDFIASWQSGDIEPMMNYIEYHRVPEAEFDVGAAHHFVFACDWRRFQGNEFMELMRSRELDGDSRLG